MDYDMLREKVELLIKGLGCMCDPEAEQEFLELLDDFSERMLVKCRYELAKQDSQKN